MPKAAPALAAAPLTHIKDLTPDPANRRRHTPRNLGMVVDALHAVGAARSIVIDEDNVILAGNGVTEAAAEAGITKLRIVDADGDEIIAVRRSGLSPDQKRKLALYDNRTGELAEWSADQLAADVEAGLDLQPFFFEDELAAIINHDEDGPAAANAPEDEIPKSRPTSIRRGDLFELGPHRILCGDSTSPEDQRRVIGALSVDTLLFDPPYCSGGFQESGKSAGSVGTKSTEMVRNDTLSTRGYTALLRTVIGHVHDAATIYAFTDWRMWITLYDVVESSGFGVRNMIVWDKGSPGMGVGWRTQHELIMYGRRGKSAFRQPKKGQAAWGNVITCTRTGNIHHVTEKPVAVIERLLIVSDLTKVAFDPFLGSGTTLIAADKCQRTAVGIELDPGYCQVAIDRWEGFNAGGLKAIKVGDAPPALVKARKMPAAPLVTQGTRKPATKAKARGR